LLPTSGEYAFQDTGPATLRVDGIPVQSRFLAARGLHYIELLGDAAQPPTLLLGGVELGPRETYRLMAAPWGLLGHLDSPNGAGGTSLPPPTNSFLDATVAMAFFASVAWKVARDTPAAMFFAVFALLTIVTPAGLYLVGRRAAAARAARFPELHVRIAPEGIAAGALESAQGLAWSNIVRVWESERNLTLVLNPYMAVQLPRDQVPAEARELILSKTRGTLNR